MKIAVVGATGAVGLELLSILDERSFPVRQLRLFASERSQGKTLEFAGQPIPCQVLERGCFAGCDFVFFDASDAVSQEWVPEARAAGAFVIDNSSVWRMDPAVCLAVPEIHREELTRVRRGDVVAGPNCSTAGLVMALRPIQQGWGLEQVVVTTFQSVSGAGTAAMRELEEQTRQYLRGNTEQKGGIIAHPIAFNCVPQIGRAGTDGYTSEENKIREETRKILAQPDLAIVATTVRVPTFRAHAESVWLKTKRKFELVDVRKALSLFPGLELLDEPSQSIYPLNRGSSGQFAGAALRDPVQVGRLRRDPDCDLGLNLWLVSDNLRKGAALNAVQIAEVLLEQTRSESRH